MNFDRVLAMAGITAEEVMAYADGVLAPHRRQAVSDAFVKYPDLLQLLEIYLVRFDEPYDNLPNPPLPEQVLGELLEYDRAAIAALRESGVI